MADESADDELEAKRTSPIMVIVFMLVATLIAGGAGFGAGQMLFAPMIAAGPTEAEMPAMKGDQAGKDSDHAHDDKDGKRADANETVRGLDYGKLAIIDLDPITTNIGAPQDVWARMELSVAAEKSETGDVPEPALIEAVQADFLAYMRTVRLRSVSLPSGFQHLVTDLERLAAARSDGQIKRVFVKALLLE